MKGCKFAQISMEYLVLVGFVMVMIVPSVYLYSERQKSYQSEMTSAQINQAGTLITDNVKTIYSLGKGSKTIIDVNLPPNIVNMSIFAGRELVFRIRTAIGDSDMMYTCYFCSDAGPTLNGTFAESDFSQGRKTFRVTACTNYILIERVFRNATGDFISDGTISCN